MPQWHSLPRRRDAVHESRLLPLCCVRPAFYLSDANTTRMNRSSKKSANAQERSHQHALQPLRYRTKALWLLGLYILLIFVPWVLTCVLAHRPLNSGSYMRQQGFSDHDVSSIRNWKTAVDVLNSVAGLITSKQYRTRSYQLLMLITSIII
jgi:hypothetical protein